MRVRGCGLNMQQRRSTPNGILFLTLFALKSSLDYINHHVSEIHSDSYTFFYFFPTAVLYSQIIYK